jgi:hypothetical protein
MASEKGADMVDTHLGAGYESRAPPAPRPDRKAFIYVSVHVHAIGCSRR